MSHHILAAWLAFAIGLVVASTVVLVGGALVINRDGRDGGARREGCRRDAGRHGCSRRGNGSPRRTFGEEMVELFVTGQVTLDEMRDLYERGKR